MDPTALGHVPRRELRIWTPTILACRIVWPRGWVVMMATVLRLEGEAMRAREWGAASNTAAVDRAWWSVAADHELNF